MNPQHPYDPYRPPAVESDAPVREPEKTPEPETVKPEQIAAPEPERPKTKRRRRGAANLKRDDAGPAPQDELAAALAELDGDA
jgi:hypothetical protein